MKGSAVVSIGVGRHGVGCDNSLCPAPRCKYENTRETELRFSAVSESGVSEVRFEPPDMAWHFYRTY